MAEHWNGGSGGKGSRPRPFSVSQEEFDNRFEAIFGKKENKMQVRVAEEGKKIGSCGCGRSPTGECIGWHGLNEEQLKQAQANWAAQNVESEGGEI
jgi:hypothetical protein